MHRSLGEVSSKSVDPPPNMGHPITPICSLAPAPLALPEDPVPAAPVPPAEDAGGDGAGGGSRYSFASRRM
jgi:hypothetical protein